jgi:hypothetical protein
MQVKSMSMQRLVAAWRRIPRSGAMAIVACMSMAVAALAAALVVAPAPLKAEGAQTSLARHMGVASCAGSTCHGLSVPEGKSVRQDELRSWQEESSPGGAHSRAYRVLLEPRGREILTRLGYASNMAEGINKDCAGCHTTLGAPKQSDGVGCESCHGAAGGWLSSHYVKGATHKSNLMQGMANLTAPGERARVCLDCHFSGDAKGQFVSHRIMAAGHPRVSFELDLFSTLQQHWDEDGNYVTELDGSPRKPKTNSMQMWAVGQAEALKRSLEQFSQPGKAQNGIFPEFYFYDCHSCHRRIYDGEDANVTAVPNSGRASSTGVPYQLGMPPYNDENIIMLMAAARVVAPDLAATLDQRSRAFHSAMAQGRSQSVQAAQALRQTANQLSDRFAGTSFGKAQTFAIMESIASDAISPRFTDYEGAVQSVMAIDTLLNGMVNQGLIAQGSVGGLRSQVNQAYAAVREPNSFQPAAFRRALGGAIRSIRSLR